MYNGTTAGADGIVRLQPNLVHVRHRCRQTGARAEKYVEWKARGTRATTRYCSSKGSSRTPVSGSQDTQWTQWTRSRLAGDTPRWPKGKRPGEKSRRLFFYGGRIRQDLDIIQCTPCPCRQIEKRGGLRRDFCLLIPQDWPAFPSDLRLCPTHESKSSSMAKPPKEWLLFNPSSQKHRQ